MLADATTLNAPIEDLAKASDPEQYGHKAANLAVLMDQGFDVPAGFVIPVDTVPDKVTLAAALERLGEVAVAVRSSGRSEDSADHSMAGAYDSFLDVRGVEAVHQAILRCRASAHSARVRGIEDPALAVLVQTMVPADAAGVAFSANPVSGDRDEVVVNAVAGLADKLVSGEVPGDAWSVRGGKAERVRSDEGALDPAQALRVAELARRVEQAQGRAVDIEWAFHGDTLHLIQARPITVLPVKPEIALPKGTWQKDVAHFPGTVSPFGASAYVPLYDPAIKAMIDTFGLMPDMVHNVVIGHEVYSHVEPDDGGAAPPPWWLLAVVARVLPSLRRKLARAREAMPLIDRLPPTWEAEHKPRLLAAIRELADVDLTALDDAGLWAHLDDVNAFSADAMHVHFQLTLPYMVRIHELVVFCREHLDWDTGRAVQLLQGLSTASSAPTRELAEIASFARERPSAEVIRAGRSDFVEQLEQVDPPTAAQVRRYLARWGLRTLGYDPGTPSMAEQPGLLAGLLSELIDAPQAEDLEARRQALVAETRASVPEAHRARFDEVLAAAELVYPQREDNVLITDNMPAALLRRFALEVGRRLVVQGAVASRTDALMLDLDELRAALDGTPVHETVLRRKSELAWVRANPGPLVYGPEPGAMPDLRGLPEAARRVNGALLWALEEELTPPKPVEGEGIGGIPASPGTYTGRVRVIRDVGQIGRLRHGEVLVCRTTTPAWTLVFQRAGALVTDGGSALSHAAIVAREHGIPAVVATGTATRTLKDGDLVTVDGNSGTIVVG